jgi:WhiB family redox-sensing transcriptional regulator
MVSWHRAACLGEDPELFFPEGNTGPALLQLEAAKAVCHRCEVAQTCLTWAIDSGQDAGVWGGLSEEERSALKSDNAPVRRAG